MSATALGRRLAIAGRLGWPMAAFGFAAGFGLQALLPLEDWWLALATALGCASVGALLLSTDPDAPTDLPPKAQVERWGTAAQFGHAFAVSALALAGLGLGAGLATAAGL